LHRFNIALINDDISEKAIGLLQDYRLSHGLTLPDCFIAATSIVTDIELFTYNIKDFRFISELKLYKSLKIAKP
jgi:predicted nucleic acid-binding protein